MDDAYNEHRTLLIERFTGTTNSNAAEQLVKMCLLKPAPPELIQRLLPAAEFLRKQSAVEGPRMAMLVNTALALYELRVGNPAEAILWADRALPLIGQQAYSTGGDYPAFLRSILAMACRQTGDTARAETEARSVREFVKMHGEAFQKSESPENTYFVPVIERALAMILAREALGAE
jgi:hypothetical protein